MIINLVYIKEHFTVLKNDERNFELWIMALFYLYRRVLELLCNKPELSKTLRVPAISRLQKVHNVEVVFKALGEQNIDAGKYMYIRPFALFFRIIAAKCKQKWVLKMPLNLTLYHTIPTFKDPGKEDF